MTPGTVFEVRRDTLRQFRWNALAADRPLTAGQVLLGVEAFAFTSNNVTYAAYGDRLRYWDFFPAPTGWGRIPVWAFLRALDSHADDIVPGDRFYGYAPMATHLVVEADRISPRGFVDGAATRQPMAPVYNRYSRAIAGASFEQEALEMLLRPLFLTSYLLFEFLLEADYFGASRLVFSSASSKTAYGAAWLLARKPGVDRIGLTSARNRAFVESLGCYDRVVTYEDLETLSPDEATAYIDFSGGAALLARVHHHFPRLRHSATVGGTQWDGLDQGKPLPGPKPALFFAAPLMTKGGQGLRERMDEAWKHFCQALLDAKRPLMKIERQAGRAAVEAVYGEMIEGRVNPENGYILSIDG